MGDAGLLQPDPALGPGDRIICLLVDDLEENLLVLSALLQPLHAEILTARSGAEALDRGFTAEERGVVERYLRGAIAAFEEVARPPEA